MINKWNYRTLTSEEEQIKKELSQSLGIDSVLCALLALRGIKNSQQAKDFFDPKLENLHDPFLMKDMDRAVDRINTALKHKEKILIYGDYDVDGTTAVTLVYKYLHPHSMNMECYIPDRYNEGYGISKQGIDYAATNGFTLIIALDCGIKAIEKVAYAKSLGIDFIICDHHNPDETLPDAIAVLDPKREDCSYPYADLSGCGVGFKLMQAFAINNHLSFDTLLPLLDLVAISIASDIVPLMGENRILSHFGLIQINTHPSIGLKAIIEVCGLSGKEIGISDIVFKIGPRINASGRIQCGKEVVDLLISKDLIFAKEKSECIDQYNQTRKDLDKNITEQANAIIDSLDISEQKSLVVFNPDWHKGVIGIVASRLTELYYRPTVVLTQSGENGEFASGSARSVPGFDIYKAIDSCRDLLENFGGHLYAAGLTMKIDKVEAFRSRFEQYVQDTIEPDQLVPQIDIDGSLDLTQINDKFYQTLKKFNPFGPNNPKPYFVSHSVVDTGRSRKVGKMMDHLRVEISDIQGQRTLNGIGFGLHDRLKIMQSAPFHICYTVEENYYNGKSSLQLHVKDIKEA